MSTKTYVAVTKGDNRRVRVCAVITLQYSQDRFFVVESTTDQAIPYSVATRTYAKTTTEPFRTAYFIDPASCPDMKVIVLKRRDIKETLYETV